MIEKDILERLRVYNESRSRMGEGADTLCVDAAKEIASLRATLRAKSIFRVKEIATLRAENERLVDEAYNARQAAKGENALRLEAERERMNGQIQNSRSIATLCSEIERWVKEVAHLKLAAAKAERESAS